MSGHCTLSSRKKYALKALSKGPDAMSLSRLFLIRFWRLFARPPDVRESAKDFGSSCTPFKADIKVDKSTLSSEVVKLESTIRSTIGATCAGDSTSAI